MFLDILWTDKERMNGRFERTLQVYDFFQKSRSQ
jgi:hypothetical protein